MNRLWPALPVEVRWKILRVLGRVVARQLGLPPNAPEVPHERP
jgi:hypothetical protein